jgi:hypothetical protein
MSIMLVLSFILAASPAGTQAAAPDVSGAWTITLTFVSGKATHTAEFVQKKGALTGTYTGSSNEGKLTGTVKGNTIIFTGSLKIQAQTVSFQYTGTIEGDTMKGTVDMGEYWTGTWTAKRKR